MRVVSIAGTRPRSIKVCPVAATPSAAAPKRHDEARAISLDLAWG